MKKNEIAHAFNSGVWKLSHKPVNVSNDSPINVTVPVKHDNQKHEGIDFPRILRGSMIHEANIILDDIPYVHRMPIFARNKFSQPGVNQFPFRDDLIKLHSFESPKLLVSVRKILSGLDFEISADDISTEVINGIPKVYGPVINENISLLQLSYPKAVFPDLDSKLQRKLHDHYGDYREHQLNLRSFYNLELYSSSDKISVLVNFIKSNPVDFTKQLFEYLFADNASDDPNILLEKLETAKNEPERPAVFALPAIKQAVLLDLTELTQLELSLLFPGNALSEIGAFYLHKDLDLASDKFSDSFTLRYIWDTLNYVNQLNAPVPEAELQWEQVTSPAQDLVEFKLG